MQAINQFVFGQQKTNCEHFNVLKDLILEHHTLDIIYLPGQKTGGASFREGASIRINTVI